MRFLCAVLFAGALWACGDDEPPRSSGPPMNTAGGGGASNTSTASGAGGSLQSVCESICDDKAELGCADYDRDTCLGECTLAPEVMPWCADLAEDWVRCAGTQPPGNHACSPEAGEQPILASGCGDELVALVDCFNEGPDEGLPDLSQECSVMCAAQSTLACVSTTCETDCIEGMEDALTCNGAFAGMVYCLSLVSDPMYICNASNAPELVGDRCTFYEEITFNCMN